MNRSHYCFLLAAILLTATTQSRVSNWAELPGTSPAHPLVTANWVATDGLGRTLPSAQEVGLERASKYVGIFYFLWHGEHGPKAVYDITKILKDNPGNPQFGPEGAFHWWGEPEAGYYRSTDPWVIRRNLQMLTNAGIDILFFDATNGYTYLPVVRKLCQISMEMRQQGWPTPYICFVTNDRVAERVADLYTNFYARNEFADLWFHWQGKPLILGKVTDVANPTLQSFFTWRYSWAWTNARNEPHHWQWIDDTPQDYGWDTNPSVPEEIPVAIAGHPVRNLGKSSKQGHEANPDKFMLTQFTTQGRYFDEQWQRALAVNPSVVFVTGWNEWMAQRFVAHADNDPQQPDFLGKKPRKDQSFFIDLYNEEFNRDSEPMQGGYTDNYYYQLVANVRRFKGLAAPDSSRLTRNMLIDGKFTDWQRVQPVYRDWAGDVTHRNWIRADSGAIYTNTTGRNDIVESKAAFDAQRVYFWAKTAKKLTGSSGKNWMLLFIDTDGSKKTGWEGYDLVLNRVVTNTGQTSVHRWQNGRWQAAGQANYRVAGNQLELSLPRTLLGNAPLPHFDFHWADNIQRENDITAFFVNGDSAPDRRFNYRFTGW